MIFLNCQNISKSYGNRDLFSEISFGVFKGDKIGLIGPNGAGKSTLLKILAGFEEPDEGLITRNRSLRLGYIPQQTLFPDDSIQQLMEKALEEEHTLSDEQKQTQIAIILSKLDFKDPTFLASSLSGGWKKRLALGLELIRSPDLLLLDEPTNHLDLEGVIWLENFLQNASFSYIVISHDRYFLEHTTNQMMELNKSYPKGLFSTEGSYRIFLEKREGFLQGQLQQERSLNSKVRREIEWLKQNPKARTTKSQSRIQEAEKLIQDLQEIKTRNRDHQSQLDFSSSSKESQKLLVATNLSHSMGERTLFSGINLTLSPRMRLGVVGLNGSGKTTLLRLLSGELIPDKGTIKYANGVKLFYFDQHRTHLSADLSLRRALAPQGETVCYRGQSIHVNSWCRRFLFSPDRLDLPFGQLSGGEKARVHIARLMLESADILLLDEPTNDLDFPTLELLEQSLLDFPGALVLISHDRYFLNQLSTVILGLGTQSDHLLFADYQQWETYQAKQTENKKEEIEKKEKKSSSRLEPSQKMTFAEKREWEQMEEKIMQMESEITHLQQIIHNPITTQTKLQELCQELEKKQHTLDHLYHRWEILEKKQSTYK